MKFISIAYEVAPCLFISDKVICLTYIDDCIMVAMNTSNIDNMLNTSNIDGMLKPLCNLGIKMTKEDDVAAFLGVHIE